MDEYQSLMVTCVETILKDKLKPD